MVLARVVLPGVVLPRVAELLRRRHRGLAGRRGARALPRRLPVLGGRSRGPLRERPGVRAADLRGRRHRGRRHRVRRRARVRPRSGRPFTSGLDLGRRRVAGRRVAVGRREGRAGRRLVRLPHPGVVAGEGRGVALRVRGRSRHLIGRTMWIRHGFPR
ncbi:hypothetical protein [Saccharopolyspora sp. CA-218241]|uniref:hypothetical protein n=1 Tax=Saccharopolyspora sp. CA-218241 TaxID=3240027 RepID=UPI003D95CC2D